MNEVKLPTVAERIDPNSPHYDAEFAKLRAAAFAASSDHDRAMATNKRYRASHVRRYGKDRNP